MAALLRRPTPPIVVLTCHKIFLCDPLSEIPSSLFAGPPCRDQQSRLRHTHQPVVDKSVS